VMVEWGRRREESGRVCRGPLRTSVSIGRVYDDVCLLLVALGNVKSLLSPVPANSASVIAPRTSLGHVPSTDEEG
jgi:hypothetical protein